MLAGSRALSDGKSGECGCNGATCLVVADWSRSCSLGSQLMKTAMIALLALACGATAWAGPVPNIDQLPDAGSPLLLLGMGVTVIGAMRRSFRR